MCEKENGQNPVFTVCSGSLSQSIERGPISREGALDVRESRERRDKIVPTFSPEKHRKNRNFGLICFYFFEQDRLLFARVKIGVTKFPTKTTKKDENFFLCPRFFSKVGAHPFKMSFFSAKRQTFGGGGITSKLATG